MSMKIEIEGDSRPAVALALLNMIASVEGKLDDDGAMTGVDRAWVLDTYAECLAAASGEREVERDDDEDGDDEDEEDEEVGGKAA